jgi:hypothetical protein
MAFNVKSAGNDMRVWSRCCFVRRSVSEIASNEKKRNARGWFQCDGDDDNGMLVNESSRGGFALAGTMGRSKEQKPKGSREKVLVSETLDRIGGRTGPS